MLTDLGGLGAGQNSCRANFLSDDALFLTVSRGHCGGCKSFLFDLRRGRVLLFVFFGQSRSSRHLSRFDVRHGGARCGQIFRQFRLFTQIGD